MAYIAQVDLENALGKNIVTSIYTDDNVNLSTSAIAACCDDATADCNSFLRGVYTIELPLTVVPDEVKFAAVDFGCAYTARRRPDVWRNFSDVSWKDFREAAISKMKNYVNALQRLPKPADPPANVGAEVLSGDPERPIPCPPRVFDRMGDF